MNKGGIKFQKCESFFTSSEKICKKKSGYILMLDFDNIRNINTIYGYQIGSKVLSTFFQRLTANLPKHSLIYRSTTGEYIINISNIDFNIGKFIRAIHSDEVAKQLVNGQFVKVSVSIGIVEYPKYSMDFGTLLEYSFFTMSLAKRQKVRRVHIFTDDTQIEFFNSSANSQRLVTELKREFIKHEFIPRFKKNEIAGFRLKHSFIKGEFFLSEKKLFQTAKHTKLSHDLNKVIFESIHDLCSHLVEFDKPLFVKISLYSEEMIDYVIDFVKDHPFLKLNFIISYNNFKFLRDNTKSVFQIFMDLGVTFEIEEAHLLKVDDVYHLQKYGTFFNLASIENYEFFESFLDFKGITTINKDNSNLFYEDQSLALSSNSIELYLEKKHAN